MTNARSNKRMSTMHEGQPTSAKLWKKPAAVLTLPSGNVLRLKNPGIMEMAHNGVIPNSLMSLIMGSVQKGNEMKAEEIFDSNVDFGDLFAMMDSAIMLMAVEPEIHPVPVWEDEDVEAERCRADQVGKIAEAKKEDDVVYIDDVNEEDKMFIWQWATGGTADVEQFRRESANSMAALSGLSPLGSTTKSTPSDQD